MLLNEIFQHFGNFLPALAIIGIAAAWLLRRHPKRIAEPLRVEERRLLEQQLPQLAVLAPELRERHARQVSNFLEHKDFYGCNGLSVSPEMGLLIAGIACLLSLREERPAYPRLKSVLVYPDAFLVRDPEPDELGLVFDEGVELSGESWDGQRIILSWADIVSSLQGGPGNVVAHECAHQLDDESPQAEGAPYLPDYRDWSAVMQAAFEELRAHGSAVLDDYGGESPAEFFAVAVEAYLQRGGELARHHPALYRILRNHFLIDTAELTPA